VLSLLTQQSPHERLCVTEERLSHRESALKNYQIQREAPTWWDVTKHGHTNRVSILLFLVGAASFSIYILMQASSLAGALPASKVWGMEQNLQLSRDVYS
jgi:hypothetical protein